MSIYTTATAQINEIGKSVPGFKVGDRVQTTIDLGNGEWVNGRPLAATILSIDDNGTCLVDFGDGTSGDYGVEELDHYSP